MGIQTTQGVHLEKGWYALQTRYQHEKAVAGILALKGFQTFLPTYRAVHRWKDRKKCLLLPLFPGYLFVEDAADRKLQVVNTPGVCSIISGEPQISATGEFSFGST